MSRPCLDSRFLIRSSRLLRHRLSPPHHRHASRLRASIPSPYPVIDSCPSPTCTCRAMPEGLDIDVKQPLNGTMASYAQQVLICTGKDDWTSRIEDDEASDMARGLKELLGRGGKLSDPYHNVLVTNASFPPAAPSTTTPNTRHLASSSSEPEASTPTKTGSAFLLPAFRFLPSIPLTKPGLESLVKTHLLPPPLHPAHAILSASQRAALTRDLSPQSHAQPSRPVAEALVLVCGHGGRDARCGVMGPLLRDEFEEKLGAGGWEVLVGETGEQAGGGGGAKRQARVGLVSHVGGHKYAGNVIVYVPPGDGGNALAGCGVWYGRVRPEHVDGVVKETLGKGRIVRELFRGGVDVDGRPILL